ncbi:MAG: protein kinase, partial [Gammaproteobacteria bacterium]|nr:protein kinase [Gammaproteobacteria bacterium]
LAYLAGSGERQSRETLAALLWPDLDQRQARAALRRSLSELNKRLGQGWLAADRESVGLDQEADIWLDVAQFQQRLAGCQTHGHAPAEVCPACLEPLTEAADLYRADFLTGFTLPDCPEFDEWQFFQTEGLRQNLASALERLIRLHSARGDPAASLETAIAYARRWLALDPLHEPAQRQLMQLYAWDGQQAAALRQYQLCVQILADELGLAPAEETTSLYEQIRSGAFPARPSSAPSSAAQPAPAQKIIARRYTIADLKTDLLGQGGMGTVYRGTDRQTETPVAIKVLKAAVSAGDPDWVARFVREGEALRQLNHPNIVKLLAAEEKEGRHYLVMEYVAGGSLRQLLDEEGPLPVERVIEIGLDLADALTRAHRLQIIHRDLKPANVLLAADGTPRLTDFGLARMADRRRLTPTGAVLGTVDYLSPEVCNGQRSDERSDIWALGVLLYEMLSGERPFTADTPAATLAAILSRPPPDLKERRPETPAALADLIFRMLAKDPRQRLASVRL